MEDIENQVRQLKEELEELKKKNKRLEQKIERKDKKTSEEGISRRSFLKKLGAGALGIGALSLSPVASRMRVTDNEVLRDGSPAFLDLSGSSNMNSDLDMSSNDILNVSNLNGDFGVGSGYIDIFNGGGQQISFSNANGNDDLSIWRYQSKIGFYNVTDSKYLMEIYENGPLEVNTDLEVKGANRLIVANGDEPIRVGRSSGNNSIASTGQNWIGYGGGSNGILLGYYGSPEVRIGDGNTDTNVRGDLSVNNNTVWHNGNDGSGSGLDADTVDGHNVFVQSSEPSNPNTNDIWIDTS